MAPAACILNSTREIEWIDLPEPPEEQYDEVALAPIIAGMTLPEEFHLRSMLASWERTIIQQTLHKTKGSKTEAARRLGLSKSDLSYKLSKYGLAPSSIKAAL